MALEYFLQIPLVFLFWYRLPWQTSTEHPQLLRNHYFKIFREIWQCKWDRNKHPDLPILTLYVQILSCEIRYSASNLQEGHIKNLQTKTSRFETIIQDRTKANKVLKRWRNLATLFSRLVGYDWFRFQDVSPPSSEKEKIIRKNT